MSKFYQIAIDGPAGSGKSTIAKLIAQKLGFLYIDSGAMYRAVTLYLIENNLIAKPENELAKHMKKIQIKFKLMKNKQLVCLNKQDVTREIRSSKVNKLVSEVSSRKCIRKNLVERQKKFALNNSVVMDGRDIGTIVFPDANLKIYLTASAKIRAKRRRKDLQQLSEQVSVEQIVKQIQLRDNLDSSRDIAPLVKAQDAIVIDSSNLSIDEVLKRIEFLLPLACF